MKVVILAGGKGTRLRPYTTVLPKPLMPIVEKPVIELVMLHLRKHGIKDVIVSTGYLGKYIETFLENGFRYGVEVTYSREEKPLGTAGPLSLLKDELNETFLTINGDIITTLDITEMLNFHKKNGFLATLAVSRRKVNVDYGVVKIDDNDNILKNFEEKPVIDLFVSMGINIFEPEVLQLLDAGQYQDIPELLQQIKDTGQEIGCFISDSYWLDIGRPEDFDKAVDEFDTIKALLELN